MIRRFDIPCLNSSDIWMFESMRRIQHSRITGFSASPSFSLALLFTVSSFPRVFRSRSHSLALRLARAHPHSLATPFSLSTGPPLFYLPHFFLLVPFPVSSRMPRSVFLSPPLSLSYLRLLRVRVSLSSLSEF